MIGLKYCSPQSDPILWSIIDSAVVFASVILISMAPKTEKVTELVYDVLTTVAFALQVTLNSIYREERSRCFNFTEVGFALCFLVFTTRIVILYLRHEELGQHDGGATITMHHAIVAKLVVFSIELVDNLVVHNKRFSGYMDLGESVTEGSVGDLSYFE